MPPDFPPLRPDVQDPRSFGALRTDILPEVNLGMGEPPGMGNLPPNGRKSRPPSPLGVAADTGESMAASRLTILVFPEVHGVWTARGLEHDLAAEGRTIESAVDTLLKVVSAHIDYDLRHNHMPLSAFAPAPRPYWSAFKHGTPLPIPMKVGSLRGDLMEIIAAVVSEHPVIRLSPRNAHIA